MSWNIDIVAVATEEQIKLPNGKTATVEHTALDNARQAVLLLKHAISDTHHAGDDSATRHESWVKRAANDHFENLLAQMHHRADDAFEKIELHASGAARIINITFSAGKAV